MPPTRRSTQHAQGRKAKTAGKKKGGMSAPSRMGQASNPRKINRNEVIQRGIPGFSAPRYKCVLTYFEPLVSISSGAGTAGNYVFSANGLYDPDITSTGHQPMPFDQIMASYEHYCVVSAKIQVQFRNGSSASLPMDVAVSVNAASSTITNIIQLVEGGVIVRDKLTPGGQAGSNATLENKVNIGSFGSVPQLLDNPSYEGSVAANPAEQVYFHISCWNPVTADVVTCQAEAFIEYTAIFSEPRRTSSSLQKQIMDLIITDARRSTVEVSPLITSEVPAFEQKLPPFSIFSRFK